MSVAGLSCAPDATGTAVGGVLGAFAATGEPIEQPVVYTTMLAGR